MNCVDRGVSRAACVEPAEGTANPSEPSQDLNSDAIERELVRRGARIGRPIAVVSLTSSTNEDARRAALGGAPHGATFLADGQSAGRGRGGHSWHSPAGENLYLSMLLRLGVKPAAIAPITLAVGVAVARVVERRCSSAARLKWPNDVQINGKKIAGILVEGQIRGGLMQSLVVGIGINVRTELFPDALAPSATSLRLLSCADLNRSSLAADVICEVGDAADLFDRAGMAPFLEELSRRDALLGQQIHVAGAYGVAAGIDAEGWLLMRAEDGVLSRIVAGEVRPIDGR